MLQKQIFANKLTIVFLFVCFMTIRAYAVIRTFNFPEMCGSNHKIRNCSAQFPGQHGNACLIYNTEVCKENSFSSWNLRPLSKLTSESESEFDVSILPYTVRVHNLSVSAINISLTILNKDISGFSIVITNKEVNICRIVDFRPSLGTFNIPFTFFYDCFHHLVEQKLRNVSIAFRAYPFNTELEYLVYQPLRLTEMATSACQWTPLVMILQQSLSTRHLLVKFSNAPKEMDIHFFILSLLNSANKEIQRLEIPFADKHDMITNQFLAVGDGNYTISISIVSGEQNCTVFWSSPFYVGKKPKDYTFLIFPILLIIFIACGAASVYLFSKWYLKAAVSPSKPIVLFVYPYEEKKHKFLVATGNYLAHNYGIKVNLLYNTIGIAIEWLQDKISESNVIVFIISEMFFKYYDAKCATKARNQPMDHMQDQNAFQEIDHHWFLQFREAIAFLKDLEIGSKKFYKICFSPSEREFVPKKLKNKGKFFTLPDDFDKFLCSIHGCSHFLYLLNKLLCEDHHKVSNFTSKFEDKEKIEAESEHAVENESDDEVISGDNATVKNESSDWLLSDLINLEKNNLMDESETEPEHNILSEEYDFLFRHFLSRDKCDNRESRFDMHSKNTPNDNFMLEIIRRKFDS